MTILDLANQKWFLCGWRPWIWRLGQVVTDFTMNVDIPPVPAQVPGSVQHALHAAGVLPDWNAGIRSVECEWVEHRHWEFFTELQSLPKFQPGEPIVLEADGLDYSGWVLVDGRTIATFRGALIRHRIDLTQPLGDGKPHRLSIIFDQPPEEQGQAGFTSQTRFFKPRYNFSWDWCPRFVPIGISDRLELRVGKPAAQAMRLRATVDDDLQHGVVTFDLEAGEEARQTTICLRQEGKLIAEKTVPLRPGLNNTTLPVSPVKLWWSNGEGAQPLYEVEVTVEAGLDERQSIINSRVGFKKIAWLPCSGAPADARPWVCEINGRPIFLQGFNWIPPQLDYHSTTVADYTKLITLYRDMGCNILRVWGGACLEGDIFYRLCDEAGILVWQEFPLSSSGLDNWPPEDPEAIADLCLIARDNIRRRGHHVSKLLWSGGNELQSEGSGSKTGIGVPVDSTHPCIAALEKIVSEEDPGVRFVPTSPSGPRFMADEAHFGKGEHHDVHGPWDVAGSSADWRRYWTNDDALFRSEVGVPAAATLAFQKKYAGTCELWPPTGANRFWLHTSSWRLPSSRFQSEMKNLPPEQALEQYSDCRLRHLDSRPVRAGNASPAAGGSSFGWATTHFPALRALP
jgi:beta-mannosidase